MKKMISLLAVVCLGLAIGCQDSKQMDAAKAKMQQAGEAVKEDAAEAEAKMEELGEKAKVEGKAGLHKAAGAIKDEAADVEDATK